MAPAAAGSTPVASMRAASPAIVGCSKRLLSGSSTPSASRTRETTCVAMQRVAAELEEVVVDADAIEVEERAPDAGQRVLGRRPGRLARPRGLPADVVEAGERAVVHLAVQRQRQPPQEHERAGHRGVHEPIPHERAQLAGVDRLARDVVGDDHARSVALVEEAHRAVAHARVRHDRVAHLVQVDAVAADLHLLVVAAEERDRAIRQPPREVARPVHAARPRRNGSTTKRSAVSSLWPR